MGSALTVVLTAKSPCQSESIKSKASEARQAEGVAPVVKGSGSVGMWSTCKVVHHVHAVGALVHQAQYWRYLCASCIFAFVLQK